MKWIVAILACAALVPTAPAFAQGNDDDYTPLNSRIKRDRQFPTEPRSILDQKQLGEASRKRSRNMANQFANCLWDRSNTKALDLLERTDFGFVSFEQIGINNGEIDKYYPVRTCLTRVANSNSTGVNLRYSAESMRRWYLQAAYFDVYKDGPTWIRPDYVVAERTYPLSANDPAVHSAMNLADCLVAEDPHASDYFFRTGETSEEETQALNLLIPSISGCIPQGQQIELEPFALRVWIGEALWHAAANSAPPAQTAQRTE